MKESKETTEARKRLTEYRVRREVLEEVREALDRIFGHGADRDDEFLEGRRRFYEEATGFLANLSEEKNDEEGGT